MKKKPDNIAKSTFAYSSQSITRIVINIFCLGVVILCLTSTGNPVQAEIFKEDNSKLRIRGSMRLELDDNVFRLDDAGKSRITTAEERNIASGRLTDLESISDRVISTNLELQYGLGKLKAPEATIRAEITHHHYHANNKSGYFDGQIRLTYRLGKNGSLRAQTDFTLDRFRKNYLASIIDLNDNGNIPINERSYAPGIFRELEPSITYRHRFRMGRDDTENRDLNIYIAYGGLYRHYNDPLKNRDREGYFWALQLNSEVNQKISLEIEMLEESISTPGKKEVILLDETGSGFNRDMNGDSRIKRNAPLNTAIIRSRIRNTVRIETIWRISDAWKASIEYRRRKSNFTSQNPLDVDHYDAQEIDNRLTTAISWRLKKRWDIALRFQRTDSEDLEDLGRDRGRYQRERIGMTIRHRFE